MLGKGAVGRSREPGKTMFDGGIWTAVVAILFFPSLSFIVSFSSSFLSHLFLFYFYLMTWLTTSQNEIIELLKCFWRWRGNDGSYCTCTRSVILFSALHVLVHYNLLNNGIL